MPQPATASKSLCIVSPIDLDGKSAGHKLDIRSRITAMLELGWRVELLIIAAEIPDTEAEQARPLIIGGTSIKRSYLQRPGRWKVSENPALLLAATTLIEASNPDLVVFEYADLSGLALHLKQRGHKIIHRSINMELFHQWEKIRVQLLSPGWGRKNFAKQWFKFLCGYELIKLGTIAFNERRMRKAADRNFYIGCADMTWGNRLYGDQKRASWIPPILPTALPRDRLATSAAPLQLLFMSGNFEDVVQREAAERLVNTVVPALRAESLKDPAFAYVLHIAGNGTAALKIAASPNVLVHGYIDDLDAFLAAMDAACVPSAIGWGLKLKVMEAMAAGLPVVAASQALRGFPKEVRDCAIVCDQPSDYVAAVKTLQSIATRRHLACRTIDLMRHVQINSKKILQVELAAMLQL